MEGEGKKGARGRGRGRGRGVRGARGGRGRGRAKTTATGGGRGRPKKMVIESDEEEQIETSEVVDNQVEISDEDDHDDEMVIDERENLNPVSASPEKKKDEPEESSKSAGKSDEPSEKVEFNIDDDISQLVPPTFSTVSKGPPQPMLELTWEHKYTAIGDKLPTPNIHMCIGCKLPIRIYGRLIPCKHVYCHGCATKQSHCSCCSDRVSRIEQAHLGQVFMCNHGGTRYGFDGCRRTYLSQRDLQAHFNHRHKPRNSSDSGRSDSYHGTSSGSNSTGTSGYEHGNSNTPSHYSRQNIPAHYASSGRGGGNLMSASHQSPSNSNARSSQGGESGSSTPGSRYERKSSFTRNPSWSSSYNNRPY